MLYKQGTQRIEVIVRKEDISINGTNTKDVQETSNDVASSSAKKTTSNRTKRIVVTNLTHIMASAKLTISRAINYIVGGIGYSNGDQAMQDRIQRQVELVEDATNVATDIARGAVFGSWGGAFGVAVGMGTAALNTGGAILVKYRNRERDYNYKVFKENNAIEYSRTRAGINITSGRLR